MKIIKIAQNFQMIPQNPNGAVNPDAQLQNLQNSQQALQFMQASLEASSEVLAAISRLEDAIGLDTGLRSIVEEKTNQALSQTPAYQILSKMGFVADINALKNQSKVSQLTTLLQRNIQDYSSGTTPNPNSK